MSIGIWQLVLILIVVLLLFGAGKVPNLMKDLAKGIRAFKQGLHEDEEPHEKEAKKPPTPAALTGPAAHGVDKP